MEIELAFRGPFEFFSVLFRPPGLLMDIIPALLKIKVPIRTKYPMSKENLCELFILYLFRKPHV